MKAVWLAGVVATWLAAGPAWGHSFPPVRTVVVQVEPCELVVMVGYRPGTGESTQQVLAKIASQPKSKAREAMQDVLTTAAMAPLHFAVDGVSLVPTTVRAKVGLEPGGARPMVVVLVTFSLRAGKQLAISSADPRNTRFSWTDRASHRVDLAAAPQQAHWFADVATFLLSLAAGDSPCVYRSPASPSRSSP